jgi:hypothetical protein
VAYYAYVDQCAGEHPLFYKVWAREIFERFGEGPSCAAANDAALYRDEWWADPDRPVFRKFVYAELEV